ncbi:MAG TPA: hypothetical protein VN285_03280, partial [Candidatus Deferrimicrobium sp.]|nr:hypothetical protein [Candidatus Deferrimicrobium sp.]
LMSERHTIHGSGFSATIRSKKNWSSPDFSLDMVRWHSELLAQQAVVCMPEFGEFWTLEACKRTGQEKRQRLSV